MDTVGDALNCPCIVDTSFLNNFVHVGKSSVLHRTLDSPVRLAPAVLDIEEVPLEKSEVGSYVEPRSEFLRTMYMSTLPGYGHYRRMASFTSSFATSAGELWEPTEPTLEEIKLATRFRSKKIREELRTKCPEIKRSRSELGVGEAEAVAVAVSRKWTFLTDDQASVDVVKCLFPDTPIVRTCPLLIYATDQGHISCTEASQVFNRSIVEGLGFRAYRRSEMGRERLWLRCEPPRCAWEVSEPC